MTEREEAPDDHEHADDRDDGRHAHEPSVPRRLFRASTIDRQQLGKCPLEPLVLRLGAR
jgi:hypothetical protein